MLSGCVHHTLHMLLSCLIKVRSLTYGLGQTRFPAAGKLLFEISLAQRIHCRKLIYGIHNVLQGHFVENGC